MANELAIKFRALIDEVHEKWARKAQRIEALETYRSTHPIFVMNSKDASKVKGDIRDLQSEVESYQLDGWEPDWRKRNKKNRKLDAFELPRLIEHGNTVQVTQAKSWSTHEFHTKAELLDAMMLRIDELEASSFKRAPVYAHRMRVIMQHIKHYPAEHWRRRSIHPGGEVRARVRLVNDEVIRTIVHRNGLVVCGENVVLYPPAPSRGVHRPLALDRQHAVFTCHLYDYFDVDAITKMLSAPKILPPDAPMPPMPWRLKLCLISQMFDRLDLDRFDA